MAFPKLLLPFDVWNLSVMWIWCLLPLDLQAFYSLLEWVSLSSPVWFLCCNLVMDARFFDLLLLCIWDLSFSPGSCACSFSLRFATGCIVALVLCVISMWDIWFEGCVVHVAMQLSYSLVCIHCFVVFWLLQGISQPSSRYLFGVLWLPCLAYDGSMECALWH